MELKSFVGVLERAKVGKEGKSLFLYQMPAVEFGILIREETTGTRVDYELPGYFRSSFQITVRDTEYYAAKKKIEQAINALRMQRVYLDEMFVNFCRPETQPVAFQMNNGQQVEFSVKMEICFCEAAP